MTAAMIIWTLEVLEWIRNQVWEKWPEVKLRGSAPELAPEGYKIRFRADGKQFWLFLCPEAIWSTSVRDVTALLESNEWIDRLQEAGQIFVDVHERKPGVPFLRIPESLGPELRFDHSAHATDWKPESTGRRTVGMR